RASERQWHRRNRRLVFPGPKVSAGVDPFPAQWFLAQELRPIGADVRHRHLADTRHDLELRFSHEEEPFWLKYAIGHERFHGSVTRPRPAYWLHSFLPKSCWVGSVIWSSSTLRLGHNTPLS